MMTRSLHVVPACPPQGVARAENDAARLHAIVRAEYAFLWRSLRRLGVPEADVDDAAQRALDVLARRLPDVARGSERAFLFQSAIRVASEMRRARSRDRLTLDDAPLDRATDTAPLADDALAQREARALLDRVLEALPIDVRAVFILFEIEQMTTSEIAALLEIPPGTVSSRVRRGREAFDAIARRVRAGHVTSGARR